MEQKNLYKSIRKLQTELDAAIMETAAAGSIEAEKILFISRSLDELILKYTLMSREGQKDPKNL